MARPSVLLCAFGLIALFALSCAKETIVEKDVKIVEEPVPIVDLHEGIDSVEEVPVLRETKVEVEPVPPVKSVEVEEVVKEEEEEDNEYSISIELRGDKIVVLSQLEAPYWPDPGWTVIAKGMKGEHVKVMNHYPSGLRRGDVGNYTVRYDPVEYEGSKIDHVKENIRGTTRQVIVRNVDWCRYLEGRCPTRASCDHALYVCNSAPDIGDHCEKQHADCLEQVAECEQLAEKDYAPMKPHSRCVPNGGTYYIECAEHYEPANEKAWNLYGKQTEYRPSCKAINYCQREPSPCDENAECTNLHPYFECKCRTGYFGNGLAECDEDKLAPGEVCGCKDIDECAPGKEGDIQCSLYDAKCVNMEYDTNLGRGYYCQCDEEKGMFDDNSDGISCVARCWEEDEKICPENAHCVMSNNLPVCVCMSGYEKNEDGACVDIDECATGRHNCDETTTVCVNTIGPASSQNHNGYTCECKDYEHFRREDIYRCVDIDECAENLDTCDDKSEDCVNLFGGYECECKDGFTRNEKNKCVSSSSGPKITLKNPPISPDSTVVMKQCELYPEYGWRVTDDLDNEDDLSVLVDLPGELVSHAKIPGEYNVKYKTTDSEGLEAEADRKVIVEPIDICSLQYVDGHPCQPHCPVGSFCKADRNSTLGYTCSCENPLPCMTGHFVVPVSESPYDFKTAAYKEWVEKTFKDFSVRRKGKDIEPAHTSLHNDICFVEKLDENGELEQCIDVAPPVIVLRGPQIKTLHECRVCNQSHSTEEFFEDIHGGFRAYDFVDGDLTDKVTTETEVLNKTHSRITYSVTDNAGNTASIVREIFVEVQDITRIIDDLKEFQKQVEAFQAWVTFVYSLILNVFFAAVVMLFLWLAFTVEGSRFTRILIRKVQNPSKRWQEIDADLDVEDIVKNRSREDVRYRG